MLTNQDRNISFIQLMLRDNVSDAEGEGVKRSFAKYLQVDTGKVRVGKIFSFNFPISESNALKNFANQVLKDQILHQVYVNELYEPPYWRSVLVISKWPGVTDEEGMITEKCWSDLNPDYQIESEQRIFVSKIYYFENMFSLEMLTKWGQELLANPLINRVQAYHLPLPPIDFIFPVHHATSGTNNDTETLVPQLENKTIPLLNDDDYLLNLSKSRHLSLDLAEMKAIYNYFEKRQTPPTELELEVIAQTWSEHCKHKEFSATIEYSVINNDNKKETTIINSLFKTYIKSATEVIIKRLQARENIYQHYPNWIVKVFSDNAGLVRIKKHHYLAFKVETHNTPSALDPYGGALTGILGVNRDAVATGVGGGRALFNTNVLCFGPPDYKLPLLKGQMPPFRILQGVVAGIAAGGNKMGIPTVNGSVIFDERFAGKPLVFCGTAAIMPDKYALNNLDTPNDPYDNNDTDGNNRASNFVDSAHKNISSGDLIVMAGGAVGADGLHGATVSSIKLDESISASAVQIGAPFTQKLLFDFMEKAAHLGLFKCSTDNGAGGLSSSIGELATISGGAKVQLDTVPLKCSSLPPWQIFLSESQERMSLAISPSNWKALQELAQTMQVKVTVIGEFTNSGYLEVFYGTGSVGKLSLDFLHDGVPTKLLTAEWKRPKTTPSEMKFNLDTNMYNLISLRLLSNLNICSRENIIRQYDHEVKGRSVLKPLMGFDGESPQDAAVITIDLPPIHDSYDSKDDPNNEEDFKGLIIANGICPKYAEDDPYSMSAGAFDEMIRQIIAVGGRLPLIDSENNPHSPGVDPVWSVNDNFCLPDSVYHPEHNPDGKVKLAKLVQMCMALYDMSTFFNIPLTSGKDSMKNDFVSNGKKISIPPTVLYSGVATIQDVRKVVSSSFKRPGDLIYLLGETYPELKESEFESELKKLNLYSPDFSKIYPEVPQVRKELARELYIMIMKAHDKSLLSSAHDLSDGGLLVGVAESAFGGTLGVNLTIPSDFPYPNYVFLFSESHSRLIVSIDPQDKDIFEQLFSSRCLFLGTVTKDQNIIINHNGQTIINLNTKQALNAWKDGPNEYV